jgi:hypothetical protein
MKKLKIFILLLITISTLAFSAFLYAAIPHFINFQGKAVDKATGIPLDGTYSLTFRIYNHEIAGDPDAAGDPYRKWKEVHSGAQIANGIFHVLLGSATTLDLPFNEDYWISVEVNTDGEMTPRTRLASGGYAYKAEKAEHAVTADSLTVEIETIPSGGIIMWSGTIASIPAGWVLCDGSNTTPDLRDKFVVGATQDDAGFAKTNITGSLTQTGGDTSHNHAGVTGVPSAHAPMWPNDTPVGSYNHTHTINSDDHVPPYYALAYIMKL